MAKKILNKEQDAYLRLIAVGKSAKECTECLNEHFQTTFKVNQIRNYKSRYNITSGLKPWEAVDHSKRSIMTAEQNEFIIFIAEDLGNEEITKQINSKFGTEFTVQQIKSFKANHKIKSGLTGHFSKGNVPYNKGKKGLTSANKTSFTKGSIPPNRKPIGSERTDSKDGYTYVKIQDGKLNKNWKLKHVLLWEKYNGPIPKGHKVVFANGNKKDIRIKNLVLVSDSELLIMNRNGLIYNDSELTKTGANIAKLIDKTSKLKKSN